LTSWNVTPANGVSLEARSKTQETEFGCFTGCLGPTREAVDLVLNLNPLQLAMQHETPDIVVEPKTVVIGGLPLALAAVLAVGLPQEFPGRRSGLVVGSCVFPDAGWTGSLGGYDSHVGLAPEARSLDIANRATL